MIVKPVDAMSYDDILFISERLRAWDRKEIFALMWSDSPIDLATTCAQLAANAFTLHGDDETPIAYVGAIPLWPGFWKVWMFATDDFRKIGLRATTWVKQHFIKGIVEAGAVRAECQSMDGHVEAHRWLEVLGAEREGEHDSYGKNGEIFVTYKWTKNNVKYPFYRKEQ